MLKKLFSAITDYEFNNFYREIGDTETALQYLNKSLAIDPNHLLSLQVLASIYYQKGDMTKTRQAAQVIYYY